jgi:hypothetical protein
VPQGKKTGAGGRVLGSGDWCAEPRRRAQYWAGVVLSEGHDVRLANTRTGQGCEAETDVILTVLSREMDPTRLQIGAPLTKHREGVCPRGRRRASKQRATLYCAKAARTANVSQCSDQAATGGTSSGEGGHLAPAELSLLSIPATPNRICGGTPTSDVSTPVGSGSGSRDGFWVPTFTPAPSSLLAPTSCVAANASSTTVGAAAGVTRRVVFRHNPYSLLHIVTAADHHHGCKTARFALVTEQHQARYPFHSSTVLHPCQASNTTVGAAAGVTRRGVFRHNPYSLMRIVTAADRHHGCVAAPVCASDRTASSASSFSQFNCASSLPSPWLSITRLTVPTGYGRDLCRGAVSPLWAVFAREL